MQTIPSRGGAMPPPAPPRGNGYAPSAPPAPAVSGGPLPVAVIQLAHPLPGHSGQIAEVALREPTMGDHVDCGPVMRRIFTDDPDRPGSHRMESIEDTAALLRWACALSGVPETILRHLRGADVRAVFGEVFRIVAALDEGNSRAGQTTSSSRSA